MITKSESIKELAIALAKFQGEMGGVAKDSKNPFFKSTYASLSAIIGETRELLAKHGLSYAQFPSEENGLLTILMHNSGEYIMEGFKMMPVDQKPQSVGSTITYARRYALCSILGLQVEDDDGNEASKPKPKTTTIIHTTPTEVEPQVPNDVTEQKKIIMSFVKQLEPKTDMRVAKDIAQVVSDITQLNLVPANYPKIIQYLEEEIGMRHK